MWSAVVLAAGCLLAVTSGSKIILSANPDVLTTNLTQSITMRCSLNDTDVLPTPTAGGVVGKRDVTQTTENMQTLTSLVITRNNGDHVATLIQGQQPKALADLANMQVKGNLSGSGAPGEQGYLELTWLYPTTAQTGEYVCEVNTISSLGHNVIFSTTVEIGESVPTIGELTQVIRQMEIDRATANNQVNQLANQISLLTANISSCMSTPATDHVETDVIICTNSGGWHNDNNGGRYKLMNHNFQKPYSSPPVIQLGMTSLDHTKEANTRFAFSLTSVSETGFQVKCETWGNSYIYHLSVSWISVPDS